MRRRHTLKYLEIAKINSIVTLHHGVNVLGRGFVLMIRLWIFTQLYSATFEVQHAKEINGLTLAMVIWNLVFVQSFNISSRPAVSRIIDEEVKTGTLAYSISRPYIYNLFHYFGFMGRAIPSLLVNVTLGIAIAFVMVGPIPLTLSGVAAGALLLLLGISLDFMMSLTIGLAAFWMEDTSALMWIFHKGFMVFGGAILPLGLFPENIRRVAEALPFAQLYYSAARMIVRFDPVLFTRYLGLQLAWLSFFIIVVSIMYRKGVRYVSLNGG